MTSSCGAPITSLHVIGSRELGGAERFFMRLVEALVSRGHPTQVVVRPDSAVSRLLAPTVPQLHVGLRSKWDLLSRLKLSSLIARHKPEIVQTYMGRATGLTRVPRDSGSVHIARLGGFYKFAGYFEHADAWIGNTHAICDHLRARGADGTRVHRIGNFVPEPTAVSPHQLTTLRRRLELDPSEFVVIALGRFVAKKGFDDLLRAWASTPERHPQSGAPLRLLLVGDGPERAALRTLSYELKISRRVVWAGWQDDPATHFALAQAFVCPSRHEPLGNVLLEAWTHHLPVVSTRHEGASELAQDGVNAILAPTSDPTGLALALGRLLELSPLRLQELARKGKYELQLHHSEAAVVEQYLRLYGELRLKQHPAKAS